jgi:hypothetical protein
MVTQWISPILKQVFVPKDLTLILSLPSVTILFLLLLSNLIQKFEIEPMKTIVGMNGQPDQEYCLVLRFSPDPERQFEIEKWPESPEENLERLKSCGFEVEKKALYCHRCNGKLFRYFHGGC